VSHSAGLEVGHSGLNHCLGRTDVAGSRINAIRPAESVAMGPW
jgi:hypothetical protein